MPLALFMVLGTMQLFMLLQGRLFAEHAAYMAARVGSVRHGHCDAMRDAAIVALLPSFSSYLGSGTHGNSPEEKLATAYGLRRTNRYHATLDDGHTGDIVWLFRPSPRFAELNATTARPEDTFDDPDRGGYTLEVRAVYWFPLRVPFANWVMTAMFRAWLGVAAYTNQNPLMPAQAARWQVGTPRLGALQAEFSSRTGAGEYVFPVTGTAAMRMMTPPRPANFNPQNCPHHP
mgnify:CR=1 FL=1